MPASSFLADFDQFFSTISRLRGFHRSAASGGYSEVESRKCPGFHVPDRDWKPADTTVDSPPQGAIRFQQSFAPAGMLSSTSSRCSFSSPFSVWTAEISMPQESWPIIFRGGRFRMATAVLPMRSAGS